VAEQGVTRERHRRSALPHRSGARADAEGGVDDGRGGQQEREGEIAMIKVVAPAMACQVIDWAMQVHGGAA
jgi:acyl-CoA dehydrogenase